MPDRVQRVVVDRIACTGHGVCHDIARSRIPLDEWGYPVPSEIDVAAATAQALVRLCPAAALRAVSRPAGI